MQMVKHAHFLWEAESFTPPDSILAEPPAASLIALLCLDLLTCYANAEVYGEKHVAISWVGSETGKDVFASSSKIDFSTSSIKPASSEDILYVLTPPV